MYYYQPAERVQTHSSEALFPGYVTIMNDGPSGGVDTKHGVVTLLLDRKKARSLIEQREKGSFRISKKLTRESANDYEGH